MKKLSILFLSLVALATTVTSCSKDDNKTAASAALELTIKNASDSSLAGAGVSVQLYSDSAFKNKVGTPVVTLADSKAKFTNLGNQIYYFVASTGSTNGCLNNIPFNIATGEIYNSTTGAFSAPAAIPAGVTTPLDVFVTGFGTLTITNNTTDSYHVYVKFDDVATYGTSPDATLTATAPGNTYSNPLTVDSYDVKFVRLNADGSEDLTTVVEKTAQTVTACTVTTVTNP